MKAVVLAEMLRDVLDGKIRKCRKEMLDTYMPVEVERIQAQNNGVSMGSRTTTGFSN
jgi:hypothetical protein